MSHFTVTVITDTQPSHDDLSAILAPWHEFECTGQNDQYVQDIDVTEECIEWGKKHQDTDEDFVTAALGCHGLEDKIVADEAEVDREEEHKYGYAVVRDGELIKAINRTNPNKKWDWWQVGGRWSGTLKMKQAADAIVGKHAWCAEPVEAGYGDSARLADINLTGMQDQKRAEAVDLWDKVHAAAGDGPKPTAWKDFLAREGLSIDEKRTLYWAQPAIVALKTAFPHSFGLGRELDALSSERQQYGETAASRALSTFAVVKDGQWFERGRMGWWGTVHDEKEDGDWDAEFSKLIGGLPDTAWLTVIDCHI